MSCTPVLTLCNTVLDLKESRKLAYVKAADPRKQNNTNMPTNRELISCYPILEKLSLVGGFYIDGQWSACLINTPCSIFSTCCIPPTTMWLLVELLAVYVGGFNAGLRCQVNMVFVSIHSPQPTQSSLLSAGWMTLQLAATYSSNYMHSWGHLFCHIHLRQNSTDSAKAQPGDAPQLNPIKPTSALVK